jgi:hypothetical protein
VAVRDTIPRESKTKARKLDYSDAPKEVHSKNSHDALLDDGDEHPLSSMLRIDGYRVPKSGHPIQSLKLPWGQQLVSAYTSAVIKSLFPGATADDIQNALPGRAQAATALETMAALATTGNHSTQLISKALMCKAFSRKNVNDALVSANDDAPEVT